MKIVVETNERFDAAAESGLSALGLQISMIRGVNHVSIKRDDDTLFANYPAESYFGPTNTADAHTIAARYTREFNSRQGQSPRRRRRRLSWLF